MCRRFATRIGAIRANRFAEKTSPPATPVPTLLPSTPLFPQHLCQHRRQHFSGIPRLGPVPGRQDLNSFCQRGRPCRSLDSGHSALAIGLLVGTDFGGLKNTIFKGLSAGGGGLKTLFLCISEPQELPGLQHDY